MLLRIIKAKTAQLYAISYNTKLQKRKRTIMKDTDKMLMKLPIVFDWVNFKGETVFAQINYQATQKSGKPMMDISYCATRALNQTILFTTQWDKKKFTPSHLGKQF